MHIPETPKSKISAFMAITLEQYKLTLPNCTTLGFLVRHIESLLQHQQKVVK